MYPTCVDSLTHTAPLQCVQLSRPTAVHVEAAPGTYTVTAAQPDGSKETKLKVQLEPGKSVFLTFSV